MQRTKIKVYNATLVFLMIGLATTLVTNIIEKSWLPFDNVIYIGGFSMLSVCFMLNYFNKHLISFVVLMIGANVILLIITLMSGDMFLSAIINLLLLSLSFTFLDLKKMIWFLTGFQLIIFLVSIFVINSTFISFEILQYNPIVRAVLFSICFVLFTVSLAYSRSQLEKVTSENDLLIEALQEKNVELKNAYDEMETFSYIVSHDLKAPLRSINSFTQLISKNIDRKNYTKLTEYSSFVTTASTKMSEMINDILNYSKLTNTNKKDNIQINLTSLVQEIETDLQQHNNSANIKYSNLCYLHGNRSKIKMLFQNLIENGLKYNRNQNPIVELSCHKTNGQTVYDFIDNGIGIAENNHKEVFTLFKRLHSDKEFEGTGVGLANCKRIVENHLNGTISILDNPLGGTIFRISIPHTHLLAS